MSFQTGLSGLNAAGQNLSVIGHNIANANTVGMKAGRTEFAEMVASSIGVGGGGGGLGVNVATVSQSFTQGNLNMTGNTLDVAINGGGFFTVTMPDGSTAYTRDGQFKLDKEGNIVTNTNARVMGFPTDIEGNVTNRTVRALTLPTGEPIAASATSEIVAGLNLDARAMIATSTVPPTPITTYGTTLNAYDSQGVEVPVSMYFVKTSADTWQVFTGDQLDAANAALESNAAIESAFAQWRDSSNAVDLDADNEITEADFLAYNAQLNTSDRDAWLNDPLTPAQDILDADADADSVVSVAEYFAFINGTPRAEARATYNALVEITFDENGVIVPLTDPVNLTLTSPNPNIGNFSVELDLNDTTQFGTKFAVSTLTQDGYKSGDLTGVNIQPNGVISARYSNGQTQAMGKVALSDFRNAQGLGQISGGYWVETFDSGKPVPGEPGEGKFGALQAGALEASNVDLTAELVNMITAQRSYQANAQTIKTMDQVLSTLVNLR